jgi:hypothetical protein
MKTPIGGAARVAAIAEAIAKAEAAWSSLHEKVRESNEGVALRDRLDAAIVNLAILEELTTGNEPLIKSRQRSRPAWRDLSIPLR